MTDTQLRMGIIGISGRGGLSEFWHKPNGRSIVAAAADVRTDHLEAFRNETNSDAFITTDYRELVARDDLDAIAGMVRGRGAKRC